MLYLLFIDTTILFVADCHTISTVKAVSAMFCYCRYSSSYRTVCQFSVWEQTNLMDRSQILVRGGLMQMKTFAKIVQPHWDQKNYVFLSAMQNILQPHRKSCENQVLLEEMMWATFSKPQEIPHSIISPLFQAFVNGPLI